ncbi:MAG: Crp/Fnr family transcriptional regulator [Acidobacteriota bacterium]|nr:Crp/Fnr family transcriptional regulator [Acidobacteriota bacterium]
MNGATLALRPSGSPPERRPPVQDQKDRDPGDVRGLLESTATPFAVANYRPRAPIYLQGDSCDHVMYIEQGRVWLAVTARRGKEVICDLLGPGAFLGEEALVGRAERRQTAIALTATKLLVVAKGHMIQLLRTQPDLLNRLVAHLFARNARLEANLTDQLLSSSEQRLAHMLLVLASCDERRSRRCTLPDLPQAIIAEMVGTTRSRVNFFMGRFKKRGFIEEKSGVLHVNPARLQSSQPSGYDPAQRLREARG